MTAFSRTDILIAQSFIRLSFRWGQVQRYWKVSLEGLEKMRRDEYQSVRDIALWAAAQPDLLRCSPEEFLQTCEEADLDNVADTNIDSFQGTLECSCLVFLHAELELALLELFEIVASVAPERILPEEDPASLHLQNAQGKLGKKLKRFDRGTALPEKVKWLYELFGENIEQTQTAAFEQLNDFDKMRHDVVHRPGSIPIPNFDALQKSLRDWGLQCWKFVILNNLGLKMHSAVFEEIIRNSSVPK